MMRILADDIDTRAGNIRLCFGTALEVSSRFKQMSFYKCRSCQNSSSVCS